MQGKVLGYRDGSGSITTDSGERYDFTADDWRSDGTPVAGAKVDFVVRDGRAADIFATPGAFGAGAGKELQGLIDQVGQNDATRNVVARLKATPQLPVAALILLVALLLSYASFSVSPVGSGGLRLNQAWASEEVSLVGANGALNGWREDIGIASDELDVAIANARAARGNAGDSTFLAQRERELQRASAGLGGINRALTLAYLLWLVPLAAIAVIAFYWLERRALGLVASVVLGVSALFAGYYPTLLRSAIMTSMPPDDRVRVRPIIDNAFELEFGGWLIVLGGLACLVLAFVFRRGAVSAMATSEASQ